MVLSTVLTSQQCRILADCVNICTINGYIEMLCFTKMYPKLPMQLSLIFSNTISLFHPVFSDLLICSFFTYCNENVPLGLIVTRVIICHYYLPWFEFSAITGSDNFYCHISTSFFKWIRFRHFQIGANMVYLTDKKSASHHVVVYRSKVDQNTATKSEYTGQPQVHCPTKL